MANSTSIHGRRLQLGNDANELLSNGVQITSKAVDAVITVGAEASNVRTVDIQLNDSNGQAIDYVESFEIWMFSSAAGTALSSGGSTGLAIGTDGLLQALVAKLIFVATTENDGHWDGTWTDTGTAAACVGVKLPGGRMVYSTAFANT